MFFCFFFLSNKLSSPKDLDSLEGNITKMFAKCYYKNFETFRKWRLFFLSFFSDLSYGKKYETAPSHSFCVRAFKQRAVHFSATSKCLWTHISSSLICWYFQTLTESKFIRQIPELFHVICFPPLLQKLCPETFFFFLMWYLRFFRKTLKYIFKSYMVLEASVICLQINLEALKLSKDTPTYLHA